MRATVRRDDAISVGVLIEEEHLSRRLHNFDRRAHAWDACRHAGVYGISSVPLLIQLLNDVPVLWLVPRPVLVHPPEQRVVSLEVGVVTASGPDTHLDVVGILGSRHVR